MIYGYGGNDSLYGYDNNDLLRGGNGEDYLAGYDGDDTLYGEKDDDKLDGGNGKDQIFGGDGDDDLYGGAQNDRLYGGLGDDVIYGSNWSADGASNKDKAVFDGNFEDYTFDTTTWNNSSRGEQMDVLIVTDSASGGADGFYEGEDFLIDINQLVFADQTVDVDTLF